MLYAAKSRHSLPLKLNCLQKHFKRADPKTALAVESTINHELFKSFAVQGSTNHLIVFAFEMFVYAEF